MSAYDAVLIPGDGIGPEVSAAAVRVMEAAGVEIRWHRFQAGKTALENGDDPLPSALLEATREIGAALKGPITTPVGSGFTSVNVAIRKELDLFANLRPVKSIPGGEARYRDVDLVIVRENTEGLYNGEEVWENKDAVVAKKRVTRAGSLRVAEFAYRYAEKEGRRSVTTVHKANILKESDGLFLRCARERAKAYPGLKSTDRIVDALCMDLVLDPGQHDVLLCPNLYGDIVSDLAAGLVGGLGLVPGANLGQKIGVFEAVHGSAPDIAGKGIANPTALILAGAMLLDHIGEKEAGKRIQTAVHQLYAAGGPLTPDVGGTGTTEEVTNVLIAALNA
jgi:isocitrate dehydrogenase (NAD+)